MRGRTALVASVGVTLLVVGALVGVRTWQPEEPAPSTQPDSDPEPTTLASYDTTGVGVVRGPFCDRVSPTGIERALGDVPADSEAWDNGDRVRLPDGGRDRVQEYGCRWTAADGSQATAWVLAPPVTRGQARALRRERPPGDCSPVRGDGFGATSVSLRCAGEQGTEERYAGLFGDTWLTCTLAGPGGGGVDLDVRTSEWCVTVLEAVRG